MAILVNAEQQSILSRAAAAEAARQNAQARHDADAQRAAEQELARLRALYESQSGSN
jgi:hypothetical protein